MRYLGLAGTVAFAASASASLAQVPEAGRIVVRGTGTVLAPPDMATLRYQVRGEGRTSDEAVAAMVKAASQVSRSLKARDPAIVPQVESMDIEEMRGKDCEDADEELSVGACAITGYRASQSLIAKTAKVKDTGTMVGAAGRAGATEPRVSQFELSDDKVVRRQAIAAALADARSKALAVAAGTGRALGPMLSANLDATDDEEELVVTGSRNNEPPPPPPPPPIAVELTPEPIEISANVTLTFAIGS